MARVVLILCVVIVCLGCDEGGDRAEARSADSVGPSSTMDPVVPSAMVDDEDGSRPPTSPPRWCSPQPISYDMTTLPSLPANVSPTDFCAVPAVEPPEDVAPSAVFTYRPGRGEIEVVRVGFSPDGAAREVFSFDSMGVLTRILAEGWQGFYTTGFGSSSYDLDPEGRLIAKYAAEMSSMDAPPDTWTVVEKTQTWADDLLVGRSEREGSSGRMLREWTWTYDQRRLQSAVFEDSTDPQNPVVWSADWTYDRLGRPSSVTRRAQGELAERETWRFDAAGHLVERSYESRSRNVLAAQLGGEPWMWTLPRSLDNFQGPGFETFDRNPWPSAAPELSDDCAIPARGPGHGYPDDPEYQLGVSLAEGRPRGIGFAYGNSNFGWNYGDLAWYGHDGIGSGWLTSAFATGAHEAIHVVVRYDRDGVMRSERATATMADGRIMAIERTRARALDQGIVSDSVVVTLGDESVERTLVFERDEAGFLIRRVLREGDRVLESQVWDRDTEGRATYHEVADHATREDNPPPELVAMAGLVGFGGGPRQPASWFWRYDGVGRVVERGTMGEQSFVQSIEYDTQGRRVRVVGDFGWGDVGQGQSWVYDAEGREIRHCLDTDFASINCTVTHYDEAGRLAFRESFVDDRSVGVSEYRRYECAMP